MFLKGTNSRNSNFEHPNFGISELRTSRTLLLSPNVELNELELQKSRTVRTRTQVRSIITKAEGDRIIEIYLKSIF